MREIPRPEQNLKGLTSDVTYFVVINICISNCNFVTHFVSVTVTDYVPIEVTLHSNKLAQKSAAIDFHSLVKTSSRKPRGLLFDAHYSLREANTRLENTA